MAGQHWIDVLGIAIIEVTSEDELFPITAALGRQQTNGWRAQTTGPQTIRVIFPEPQKLTRIRLHVIDRVSERTEEIVVSAGASTSALTEVARWTFTFTPRASTEEIEDRALALDGVSVLEMRINPDLRIDPDVRHTPANEQMYATITSLWLA